MGLAGPRNRTKISHDPRNTTWSNSTDRFGHRILTTLGWTPGSTLGDTESLYHQSGHITAASQAGVKIVLKDDNLGIGCNKRAREDECVGLDGLQDLLGRLNGKDEAVIEREAEIRERLKREVIVGERYGMRFVRGETYVSSDIETLLKRIEGEKKIKKEEESEEDTAAPPNGSEVQVKREKKSKREKSLPKSISATPTPSEETNSKSSSKKRKQIDGDDTGKATKDKKGGKKAPKMSKKSKNGETREERKARREREKREKETRKTEKKKKKRKSSDSDSSDSSDGDESTAPSGTATPSYPVALVGRQAVRHRFIAAKRSSVMDAKALNEIFMIKA